MTTPAEKDAMALAADIAVARALKAVPQKAGERDDFWLDRVRANAADQLAKNASAGFAWNGHMTHGDPASVESVKSMVSAEAELAALRRL